MYDLPPRFNTELMYSKDGKALRDDTYVPVEYLSMDRMTRNNGFGDPIPSITKNPNLEGVWFQTDQFALEVIFHARMRSYMCLVDAYEDADLVYVPFYGGHDACRHMHQDTMQRDRLGREITFWLQKQPAWARREGRDHFFVLGKNVWDFYRREGEVWGSNFLTHPPIVDNIWAVVTEAGPWMQKVASVPKPTAFHPYRLRDLQTWQNYVGSRTREWLFSFVGGRRDKGNEASSIRERLFWQCQNSPVCSLTDCGSLLNGKLRCEYLHQFFKPYLSSHFCLHPRGDSCSRRSVLDGMLAGCIPVVFLNCTLAEQFGWHLRAGGAPFYVTIPSDSVRGPPSDAEYGGVDRSLVEEVLRRIPEETVAAMRAEVVRLIPSFIYGGKVANDTFLWPEFKDAVDIIIDSLADSIGNSKVYQVE